MSRTSHRNLRLSRRQALVAAGGLGAAAVFGGRTAISGVVSPAYSASCLLQREVTEGPYYLDLDLVRRNIKSDRKGIPLTLKFTVVDATACTVVNNAAVEIWHADAAGQYSGVAGVSGNWLRGVQRTDSKGRCSFETIYPGWYQGRTPHIHLKVFVGGDEVHTGQVFMKDATSRSVYRRSVYRTRGAQDTSNAADSIYRQAGSRSLLKLTRKGATIAEGFVGAITLGVNAQ